MFTRIEKNKLLSVIRFGLPPKYMSKLKKDAIREGYPIADMVLNIMNWNKSYKELKLYVIRRNGKMQSFVKNKVIEYYKNKEVKK